MVTLKRAYLKDCAEIYSMQVKAFKPLLDKYNDINTNPAAESSEQVVMRMKQDFTDYYFICLKDQNIGAVRIIRLPDNIIRISPIFILPEYQDNGYAQKALLKVEELYPYAAGWQLDTIKEEKKLCHLYEKMGYNQTGTEEKLQSNMTIINYKK